MNQVIEFIDQAGFVWEKGGALMPALGLLAVYLYYLSFDLWLNRRLRFLFVLATSAPLIGLLGTVAGMLRTFDGLSMQDSYKMDLVAGGISQALVTTQAGLLIAIPAIALIHLLNRRKKDWLQCINRLESLSLRQVPSPIAR